MPPLAWDRGGQRAFLLLAVRVLAGGGISMRKNIGRGFAVMAAGVMVSAAGISGTGTPGAAATATTTARVHSGRIAGTPPASGSRLRMQRYKGPGNQGNFVSWAVPSSSITGYPYAVAATSASNAWAVGS